MQRRFELEQPLFALEGIRNGAGLFHANLQVSHEGFNARFLAHVPYTSWVPHETLLHGINGTLMMNGELDDLCVSEWSSSGAAD